MSRRTKHLALSRPLGQSATKRDVQNLARDTEVGFEQLVITSAAALKLTQKEIHALDARLERLERKVRRGK